MTLNQHNRVSAYGAVIAVCALSALASAGHSADAPPPGLPPGQPAGLPCGYEVAAVLTVPCPPPLGSLAVTAQGLNEQGDVVGYVDDCENTGADQAFFWSKDTGFVFLPMPANTYRSLAYDINDNGVIVGYYKIFSEPWRGFIYDMKTGDLTTLDPINPDGQSSACWANAINNDGVVVGARSLGETEQPYNAFIWTPDDDDPSQGTYTDLGVMNGPHSSAIRILDSGLVLGWTGKIGGPPNKEGFTYHEGVLTLLGHPDKGLQSQTSPGDVNHRGVVVGGTLMTALPRQPSSLPVVRVGVGWDFLPILEGSYSGGIWGLNDYDVFVGRCISEQWGHAATAWFERQPVDLHDLLLDVDGNLHVNYASRINNSGQILGDGNHNGKAVGFLLNPVQQSIGDLNGDCNVGGADLAIFLKQWEKRQTPADLNGDGIVDGADLAILLGNWTE